MTPTRLCWEYEQNWCLVYWFTLSTSTSSHMWKSNIDMFAALSRHNDAWCGKWHHQTIQPPFITHPAWILWKQIVLLCYHMNTVWFSTMTISIAILGASHFSEAFYLRVNLRSNGKEYGVRPECKGIVMDFSCYWYWLLGGFTSAMWMLKGMFALKRINILSTVMHLSSICQPDLTWWCWKNNRGVIFYSK